MTPAAAKFQCPKCIANPCTENLFHDSFNNNSIEPEAADLSDSASHDSSRSQVPGPQIRCQAKLRRQGHAKEGGAGQSHDNGGCHGSHPPAQVLEDEAPRQHQPNGHAARCYGDICQDPLQM